MKKPCLILFFVFVGEWLGGVCVQPAWAADPLKILKSASQASRVAEVVKGTAVSSLSQKVVVKAMQSSASSILSLPGDRSLSLPKQELSS
ncbi:MAG: hypothetical protein IKO35_03705, partial [Elusimicrobiaceae bacterium]|nr:hypothetical protein [Elusimicrobiaceae bacterium]